MSLTGTLSRYKYSIRDLIDCEPSTFDRSPAEYKERLAEIERLITEVAADVNAIIEAMNENHLTNLGENVEGAMDVAEIQRVMEVAERLKGVYSAQFEEKGGTEPILQDLIRYVALQCKDKDCLSSPDKRKFKSKDPSEIKLAKSALRLLLDEAPNSSWGNYLLNKESKIYLSGKSIPLRETLAYFWLAACDPNMPLDPTDEAKRALCVEEEKNHVLYYLADIRRAHNRLGDIRDLNNPIDEPSCPPGTGGRIGMHLHSLHTRYQVKVSPAKQFHRKAHAFFIEYFKTWPLEQQFAIMNAINQRIMDVDVTASNQQPFYLFMSKLMTLKQAGAYLITLLKEFGELENASRELAFSYYVKGSLKMFCQFDQDLQERFERITLQRLVEKIRVEVEDDLGKREDLKTARETLSTILKQITALRVQMLILSQTPIEGLIDWPVRQEQASQLQKLYYSLHESKEKVLTHIQMVGRRQFQLRLQPYSDIYGENAMRRQILSDEEIAQLTFNPYWVTKFELSFLQSEGLCKFAYLDLMRHLQLSRQKAALKLFMEKSLPNQALNAFLSDLKQHLNGCLALFSPNTDEVNGDIITRVNNLRPLHAVFRASYSQHVIDICRQSYSAFMVRDEGFLLAVLSDPFLMQSCLTERESDKARWLLDLSETMQKSQCLLQVVPAPVVTVSASLAPPLLSPAAAAAAAAPAAARAEEEKKEKKAGGLKKFLGAFSKLGLKKTASDSVANPNVVSLATRESLLAARASIQRNYDSALNACQEPSRIPALRLRPVLLNDLEVQYSQEYMMENVCNAAALSLEGYLVPGVIVKISVATCSPALVSFTTFKEGIEETRNLSIPISTLQQYAAIQFNKLSDYAHGAELLLRGYEKEIAPKHEGFRNLFFQELYRAFTEDAPLFHAVLQRQTLADLRELLKVLQSYFKDHEAYQKMEDSLQQAMRSRSAEVLPSDWEERQVPLLQSEIMAALQRKAFVEYKSKVKMG